MCSGWGSVSLNSIVVAVSAALSSKGASGVAAVTSKSSSLINCSGGILDSSNSVESSSSSDCVALLVRAFRRMLMASSLNTRAMAVPIPDAVKDSLRAKMMKSMLTSIAARNRS